MYYLFTTPSQEVMTSVRSGKNRSSSKKMQKGSTSTSGFPDMMSMKPVWEKQFPVNGQGTLIFNKDADEPFIISIEDENGDNRMVLLVQNDAVSFWQNDHGNQTNLEKVMTKGCGLEEGKVAYWYSYDRDNLVLKYGKGYRMEETLIMSHDFLKGKTTEEQEQIREDMKPYFNAEGKKFIRQYVIFMKAGNKGIVATEPMVEFEKNPFICNIPPLVLDSSKVNLFILDEGDYIFSASLPAACKELYQNVVGCELNYPEEVENVLLSDAIRYSIETDGCLLNKRLQEKAGEFSDDKNETYLRITLGHSLGKSPGIPYVLEIWPAGHFSPIHNHGNANAVIKVLFGSIHINVYNKHAKTHDAKPLKEFDAREGDVTWINRNWYQTHKLHNITSDYCATIQCYNYDAGDTTHWPYFDYISENETIEEFFPDSDFGFREMRSKVMEEFKKSKDKTPVASKKRKLNA